MLRDPIDAHRLLRITHLADVFPSLPIDHAHGWPREGRHTRPAPRRNAHMVTHTCDMVPSLSTLLPLLSGVASPSLMVGLLVHCTARYISRYTTRYTTPHPIWWYTTPHHTHHMPSLIKGWRGANGGGLLHQRSRLYPTIPDYTQIISPFGMRPCLTMQDHL